MKSYPQLDVIVIMEGLSDLSMAIRYGEEPHMWSNVLIQCAVEGSWILEIRYWYL